MSMLFNFLKIEYVLMVFNSILIIKFVRFKKKLIFLLEICFGGLIWFLNY